MEEMQGQILGNSHSNYILFTLKLKTFNTAFPPRWGYILWEKASCLRNHETTAFTTFMIIILGASDFLLEIIGDYGTALMAFTIVRGKGARSS